MYGTYRNSVPTLHEVQCDSTAKPSRFILKIIQNIQKHRLAKITLSAIKTGGTFTNQSAFTGPVFEQLYTYRGVCSGAVGVTSLTIAGSNPDGGHWDFSLT
jgi:hypothetical protein